MNPKSIYDTRYDKLVGEIQHLTDTKHRYESILTCVISIYTDPPMGLQRIELQSNHDLVSHAIVSLMSLPDRCQW